MSDKLLWVLNSAASIDHGWAALTWRLPVSTIQLSVADRQCLQYMQSQYPRPWRC